MSSGTRFKAARLTPRQNQLIKAIERFETSHCCSPTIGELADQIGLSRSTVFEHIAELRKKGIVNSGDGRARSLKIASPELKAPEPSGSFVPAGSDAIPLVGRVAAGLPIDAIEQNEFLSLGEQFGTDGVFALKVAGQSMIDAGINDGDFVICRKKPDARDGQIVVAIVDEEAATVKTFYRQKECVRLEPANSAFEPIYTSNCRIEGVVVGLLRNM